MRLGFEMAAMLFLIWLVAPLTLFGGSVFAAIKFIEHRRMK